MSDRSREDALLAFFREVDAAVEASNEGAGAGPYRHGAFLVSARAGDVELTVKDVSEEDAVLIAGELRALGARAVIRGSLRCPACGRTVPEQAHCSVCRARLALEPGRRDEDDRDEDDRDEDDERSEGGFDG